MGTFGGERDSLSRQGHSFGSVGLHHGRSKPGQSLSVFPFFKVHSHFELIDLSIHPSWWNERKSLVEYFNFGVQYTLWLYTINKKH